MTAADVSCFIHGDRATQSILASEELPPQFISCVQCANGLRALREIRALGCDLEWTQPDSARLDRVRARIVTAAASPPIAPSRPLVERLRPIFLGVVMSFAALVLVFVSRRREQRPPTGSSGTAAVLGVIREVRAARFERTGRAPDEVVRLDEGQIHISVTHLSPAERFRIVTADAAVEVRGTEFDVQAASGRLRSVTVERGRVEIRVGAHEPEVLTDGGQWAARASAPSPVPEPMPSTVPERAAHKSEATFYGKEAASSRARAVTAEPLAAKASAPLALPTVAAPPSQEGSTPREVVAPTAPPKPTAAATARRPDVVSPESQRREREDQRSERREERENRRLDRLDRRR